MNTTTKIVLGAVPTNQAAHAAPRTSTKTLATWMLAAGVAALVVLVDHLIDDWADTHVVAAWLALWAVAVVAIAALRGVSRFLAQNLMTGLDGWSAHVARRRADEEISTARKFAVEAFAESLLPVADSLTAGLAIADATAEQLREGSEATLRQLKSALERHKVIEINPETGAKFDPHQHQAISVVPAEQEANTVVSVLQKGYLIADRVLRPALVTVTAPK
jgi:molecular chaperone GrpE